MAELCSCMLIFVNIIIMLQQELSNQGHRGGGAGTYSVAFNIIIELLLVNGFFPRVFSKKL